MRKELESLIHAESLTKGFNLVIKGFSTSLPTLSFRSWVFKWEYTVTQGSPTYLWNLIPDGLRWSWCHNNKNKVYNKCHALNHSETIVIPPPSVHGKIVFHKIGPWCQKGCRTTGLTGRLLLIKVVLSTCLSVWGVILRWCISCLWLL